MDECIPCEGSGAVQALCGDDTCHGAGECLYGCVPVYVLCQSCAGSGAIEVDEDEDESPMDQEANGPC
jgi:hypothetical protein